MDMMGAGAPQSKVSLTFSCRNLPKLDVRSQSDPQVELYTKKNGQWMELGKTEVVKDNPNPNFTTHIHVAYYFEVNQPLLLKVYDVDKRSKDFIGEYETKLSQLVIAPGSTVT